MNRISLPGLLVLLAHPSPALSAGSNAAKAATAPENRIAIEPRRDQAPLLDVNIDGTDVRLQFDLGDRTALVLQKSVLDAIKAVPTGESTRFQSIDGVFEMPLYKVKRVQIGSAVFTDVTARLDAARRNYEPNATERGFLGTGLLKPYQLVIDYPHRSMTLVSPAASPAAACSGTSVPFVPKFDGEPVTEVDTDLGPAILWWDTGAPVSVLRRPFRPSSDPPGDTFTTNRFMIGNVDFGPWDLERMEVQLPGFDGFVGYAFFAHHVVCVDFPGRRLAIGP